MAVYNLKREILWIIYNKTRAPRFVNYNGRLRPSTSKAALYFKKHIAKIEWGADGDFFKQVSFLLVHPDPRRRKTRAVNRKGKVGYPLVQCVRGNLPAVEYRLRGPDPSGI